MPDQLTIRPIGSPDEVAVCAGMMATSEPWLTLKRDHAACTKVVGDPEKEVYLAVVDETIAGFLIINMRGAFIGYIQTICVAADRRGQGVGSRLIAFAEERIFRESPNVFLCVSSFNINARRLYERLGYQTIGEMPDYLTAGYGEILMRKTTGPWETFRKK